MRIGAIDTYGMQPYVYNTNHVTQASLNKLSKISDDVLDRKIDYEEAASENVNPLKKGQTVDFQSMLAMQMQRGRNIADRIMRPAQESRKEEETTAAAAKAAQPVQPSEPAQETAASAGTGSGGNISYQMQQALQAYGMFMTA